MLDLDWDDLRFFLAVSREGSLSAAARQLRTTPSRVSRHLERLEQALSAVLFLRGATGYGLTDAGEALVARAEAVETEISRLAATPVADAETSGRVRLAVPDNLARYLLMPRLMLLRQSAAGVVLDVVIGSRTVDLGRYEADLALRTVRPSSGNLKVQRLARMQCAYYAAPEAMEGFITWTDDHADLPAARVVEAEAGRSGRRIVARANALALHHAAALGGAGSALLPCVVGDPDPGLTRISEVVPEAAQDIWLVVHTDLAVSPRIRVVAEWVRACIQSQRDLIEGRGVSESGEP